MKWIDHMSNCLLTEHIEKGAIKVKNMRYLKKLPILFEGNGMELSV